MCNCLFLPAGGDFADGKAVCLGAARCKHTMPVAQPHLSQQPLSCSRLTRRPSLLPPQVPSHLDKLRALRRQGQQLCAGSGPSSAAPDLAPPATPTASPAPAQHAPQPQPPKTPCSALRALEAAARSPLSLGPQGGMDLEEGAAATTATSSVYCATPGTSQGLLPATPLTSQHDRMALASSRGGPPASPGAGVQSVQQRLAALRLLQQRGTEMLAGQGQ